MSDGTQSPCRQDTKNKTTGRIRHNRKNQTQQEKSDTTGKIRHNRKSQTQQEKSDNIRNRPGRGGRPDEEEESRARRRRARQGGGPTVIGASERDTLHRGSGTGDNM
ncbi:hypothetical protein NQD34_007876 [Periophthalmus magnuspinnatus]|nr:hypothetical protein NQD34_007876 [Periophthalmus magnuspinnatus]